jgi:outer membrane protein assembly factor BamA
MRRFIVIFIAVFLSLNAGSAFGKIRFQGNISLTDDELTRGLNRDSGMATITDQVVATYRNFGYYNAVIQNSYTNRPGDTVLVINEGRASVISALHLNIASDSVLDQVFEFRDDFIGHRASQAVLGQFAAGSIRLLADTGFPFARGEWTGFSLDQNNDVIASFRIIPGPRTILSGLRFKGSKRTRPSTLEKASELVTGNPYSEGEVSRSEKMIGKLPYVDIASPYALETSPGGDSCVVVYSIRELPSTRIDGFGGLVDIDGKTDFIGQADIEFGDIFGTGRTFGLFWNKKDSRSKELRLRYLEPFILNSGLDMELEASQIDRDTLYITTAGKVRFLHDFGVELRGTAYFSIEKTVPETGSAISTSLKRAVGIEFRYIRTDFEPNPESGYEFGSELEYKYRHNEIVTPGQIPPSDITSAGVKTAVYFPVTKRIVAASAFQGWGIVSADGITPPDEFRFIGGIKNLRGYTEQQFPAYRYVILTFETRLLTGDYSRAFLFGDLGFIKGSQDSGVDYKFKPGYGLGLVSGSGMGRIKVEIGWGDRRFPSGAVLNVGIGGRF